MWRRFWLLSPDHQSNKSPSVRAVSQIWRLVLSDMKMAVNGTITAALWPGLEQTATSRAARRTWPNIWKPWMNRPIRVMPRFPQKNLNVLVIWSWYCPFPSQRKILDGCILSVPEKLVGYFSGWTNPPKVLPFNCCIRVNKDEIQTSLVYCLQGMIEFPRPGIKPESLQCNVLTIH